MITDRDLELMHADIDGENDPAGARRLHDRLQEDAEFRQYYEELRAAVVALEQATPFAPPEGLRRSVLAAVAAGGVDAPVPRLSPGRPRWRVGTAGAFAAGLALGALLLVTFLPRANRPEAPPLGDLYGAAGTTSAQVRETTLRATGVEGRVRVGYAGDGVTVTVELDAATAAAGAVRLDVAHGAGLVLEAVRLRGPSVPTVTTGAGLVALEQTGRGACEFVLRGQDAGRLPLTFTLRRGGAPLLTRTIEAKGE